jgi:hypothetical protein
VTTETRSDEREAMSALAMSSTPDARARRRPRFQISLTLMLLLMVVFAGVSAALFYAARVPAVRQELSMLLYGEAEDGGEDVGRTAHRAFIMFTFTSPLLMATVLSIAVSLLKRFQRDST